MFQQRAGRNSSEPLMDNIRFPGGDTGPSEAGWLVFDVPTFKNPFPVDFLLVVPEPLPQNPSHHRGSLGMFWTHKVQVDTHGWPRIGVVADKISARTFVAVRDTEDRRDSWEHSLKKTLTKTTRVTHKHPILPHWKDKSGSRSLKFELCLRAQDQHSKLLRRLKSTSWAPSPSRLPAPAFPSLAFLWLTWGCVIFN